MSSDQLQRLSRLLHQEGKNHASKVIVLQSAGDRTFCAGANFDELLAIRTIDEAVKFFRGFAELILAIASCDKLVIGRIQGKAVGGGVGLVAALDYCIANKWADVRLSELSIGIGPYVIEPAIHRKIGKASFSQLALNPQVWQSASWAHEKGLYQELLDTNKHLDDRLTSYLQMMTSYSFEALKSMKQMLWRETKNWTDLLASRAETSGKLLLREETQHLLHSIVRK